MKPRHATFLLSLYLTGAVACFGLSYNLDYESTSHSGSIVAFDNTFRAGLCGAAWPLWVAVKTSQYLRPERNPLP